MRRIAAALLSLIIMLFPSITAGPDSRRFAVTEYGQLSNADASANTRAVYGYICSVYHHGIITGQQESNWYPNPDYEIDYIEQVTGRLPALRGFDFINDNFADVVERSKQWWERGGIVTICWHCGSNFDKGYPESLHTDIADW
ncbi:MAG TPA: glycosyl hydrolase, partial [Clostridiales bacterium]|nr:glycosyl hydrolase [Clostridiales bacterium]